VKGTWGRRLGGVLIAMVIVLGVLYAGDWLVWRWHMARGAGYGVVEVHQFLATSLKGNKTEYDMTGTIQEQCSRSIFPQNGNPACWWLARHNAQWE
jgi:hypothetical protein